MSGIAICSTGDPLYDLTAWAVSVCVCVCIWHPGSFVVGFTHENTLEEMVCYFCIRYARYNSSLSPDLVYDHSKNPI